MINLGAFAIVRKCVYRATKEEFAVKVIKKRSISSDSLKQLNMEVFLVLLLLEINLNPFSKTTNNKHKGEYFEVCSSSKCYSTPRRV